MASILKENNLAAPAEKSVKIQAVDAKSDSLHVRDFTLGAGQPSPSVPQVMTPTQVDFITKMILDEVMELMATHYDPATAKEKMKGMIDASKDIPKEEYGHLPDERTRELHQAAAQADALVDVYYYMQNAACKSGLNLSSVFSMVHAANMAKRDPATGQFLKREDGKIIKPQGWKAPDVEGEIVRQDREGSWS
mmetsp:Transcript_12471/g.24761  ORF Transcript_12471/g.24761 Transcript_12471/m.24761 type:complete len:193 (+) Transcript_12471:24-602(+)